MKVKLKKTLYFLCIVSMLGLISCFTLTSCNGGGDGDDSGSSTTDPSDTTTDAIDDDAAEIAMAASETSKQIVSSQGDTSSNLDLGIFSNATSPAELLKERLLSLVKEVQSSSQSKSLITIQGTNSTTGSIDGDCGGTASWIEVNTSQTGEGVFPATFDYDLTYDSFCVSAGSYEVVYTGAATCYLEMTSATAWHYEIEYDITYTSNIPGDTSGTVNYSETCDHDDDAYTCSTGIYQSGSVTYHTSDISVSGDASSGYNISYTLVDSDGNTWEVDFNGLTRCENGNIGSGSGTIVYNGNTISIEFLSCSQFKVTYDGHTETFDQ